MVNYYSIGHLAIWLLSGRFTSLRWPLFLSLSLGWELLELVLPFEFAVETIGNKIGDVIVNVVGFAVGRRWREAAALRA